MKTRLTAILAAISMLCSFQFFSIPAKAAGWPSYARNVSLETSFYETGTYSDPYSYIDASYMKVFRFQMPGSGKLTVKMKAGTDSVPCFRIYRTSNTEDSIAYGYSGNRSSYDYDYSSNGFWSNWTFSLGKGSYYMLVLHHSGTMNIRYACKLAYTPSFSGTALTSVSAKSRAMVVRWRRASNATGYQIQYSRNSNMKNSKIITIKGRTTTARVIRGLSRGKRYYVRVRAYKKVRVSGVWHKYYKKWSSTKSVVVK